MTGLQTSFNGNRRWARACSITSYILETDKYPWIGMAANQFGGQPESERDVDDYLTPFFLVFFFIYAICRIML